MKIKLLLNSLLLLILAITLNGCAAAFLAGGAVGGYYVAKHY